MIPDRIDADIPEHCRGQSGILITAINGMYHATGALLCDFDETKIIQRINREYGSENGEEAKKVVAIKGICLSSVRRLRMFLNNRPKKSQVDRTDLLVLLSKEIEPVVQIKSQATSVS